MAECYQRCTVLAGVGRLSHNRKVDTEHLPYYQSDEHLCGKTKDITKKLKVPLSLFQLAK